MKFRMMPEKKQRRRETYELWFAYFKHIRDTTICNHKTVSVPIQDIYVLRLLRKDIKWASISWEKYSKFDSHIEVHIEW